MAKAKKSVKAVKAKKTQKKSKFEKLFDKKPHIEFFVALLSIPFFLSVILINFNTLKGLNEAKLTPTPAEDSRGNGNLGGNNDVFYAEPIEEEPDVTAKASTQPCNKSLGPVEIASPEENESVNANPVTLRIAYDDETYCGAAWSYRVNGGEWSEYDDRSVALYNLPRGSIKVDLRVRSIASDDDRTITRNFVYTGQSSSNNPPSASGSGQ